MTSPRKTADRQPIHVASSSSSLDPSDSDMSSDRRRERSQAPSPESWTVATPTSEASISAISVAETASVGQAIDASQSVPSTTNVSPAPISTAPAPGMVDSSCKAAAELGENATPEQRFNALGRKHQRWLLGIVKLRIKKDTDSGVDAVIAGVTRESEEKLAPLNEELRNLIIKYAVEHLILAKAKVRPSPTDHKEATQEEASFPNPFPTSRSTGAVHPADQNQEPEGDIPLTGAGTDNKASEDVEGEEVVESVEPTQ